MAMRTEWVFPNVSPRPDASGLRVASGVRIFPRATPKEHGNPVTLVGAQVLELGLGHVPGLIAALSSARIRALSKPGWSVSPSVSELAGHSAQLAATLAYIAALADDQVVRRLEFMDIARVWATGEVFREPSGAVRLRSVGGPQETVEGAAFAAKLRAFERSGDRMFFCVARDLVGTTCPTGCRYVSLEEFVGWLDVQQPDDRVIVGIEPHEFVRLMCVLFPGLVPAGDVHAILFAWRGGAQGVVSEVLRSASSALTHEQPLGNDGKLFMVSTADSALRLSGELLRRVPNGVAAIHVGDIVYDGYSATGAAVNFVAGIVNGSPDGSVRATEPAVVRLTAQPYGLLLAFGQFLGAAVFDVTPSKHPYRLALRGAAFSKKAYIVSQALTPNAPAPSRKLRAGFRL